MKMRVDELRRALDDAAGPRPDPFPARDVVLDRARGRRRTQATRTGLLAVAAIVVVAVTFALARKGHGERVRATNAGTGVLTGLAWSAEPSPLGTYPRIVRAGSETYLVGTTGDAALIEADAGSRWRTVFEGTPGGDDIRRPAVNDIVRSGHLLVAVGQDVAFSTGEVGAAAWWSGDSGQTWTRATVPQPDGLGGLVLGGAPNPVATVARLVAYGDRWYAFGGTYEPHAVGATTLIDCHPLVWVSSDGMHWTAANVAPVQGSTARCTSFVGAAAGPSGLLAITSSGELFAPKAGVWTVEATSGDLPAQPSGIVADAHGYVAFGSSVDATISWSADGRFWTRVLDSAPGPGGAHGHARIEDVARSGRGFLAVGWATSGASPASTDAVVFASADGRSWTEVRRDGEVFATRARADGVVASARGFDVVGVSNQRGSGSFGDPVRQDPTLWRGD